MAQTSSTFQLKPGDQAPLFKLCDPIGNWAENSDFKGKRGLLVMFICNHCPFVKHIRDPLAKFCAEYQALGIGIVGINSNDVEKYPDDSIEKMYEEGVAAGYTFPYLFDESQMVAQAYGAACTPDFFLFNEVFDLFYAGQFDSSRPGNNIEVTGKDLKKACDLLLEGKPLDFNPSPSMGCNIKWKAGNEPPYFG